jgi:TMEM175 potassium channel family protein
MANSMKARPERLATFSDGVFAVIITIMVLELKPPHEDTFRALLNLWPLLLSYAVSYLFIAIVWVNHHHLLRFADDATPVLIWWNFAHLFMVSFVPFSTAWIADTRFAALPVSVYAFVFVLVNAAYAAFQSETLRQADHTVLSAKRRREARIRSIITLISFAIAGIIAIWLPYTGFAVVCLVLIVAYIRPERKPEVA